MTRPYGNDGQPMIWSGKPRYISFKKLPYNISTFERVREAVKARVRTTTEHHSRLGNKLEWNACG